MKTICKKLWLKINLWAFKYCPPGYRADTEMSLNLLNWLVAVIYSLITFAYGFIYSCRRIVIWKESLDNEIRPLSEQEIEILLDAYQLLKQSGGEMGMSPFFELVQETLCWYSLSGILVMVTFMVSHYMHYRSETKSIYVMKRLKGNKLIESYFMVPVRCFYIHMAICLGLLLVYYLSYRIAIGTLL